MTIPLERAQQIINGCDGPGCNQNWKYHDPGTGQRYCDDCAALGWGNCSTRCQPARKNQLPAMKLYPPYVGTLMPTFEEDADGNLVLPDRAEAYKALFAGMDKKHGPVTTAEVVHDDGPPLGELPEATEAAMVRFLDVTPAPDAGEDGE